MSFEEFKLHIIICPKCKKKMIDASYMGLYNSFPVYIKFKLETQLSEKDMVIRSETKEGYHYLCKNCEGNMEFKCVGCKETRLKKDIKYKYGDPPDFLCNTCYNTKSAKEWDDLVSGIAEEHRWDYA